MGDTLRPEERRALVEKPLPPIRDIVPNLHQGASRGPLHTQVRDYGQTQWVKEKS